MLETDAFLKKDMRMKDEWRARESNLYREKVVKVLKRLIEMCLKEGSMQFRTVEKERCWIKGYKLLYNVGRSSSSKSVASAYRSSILEQGLA